jgi:hypothetical protein
VSDRALIAKAQLGSGAMLVVFVLLFGCRTALVPRTPPLGALVAWLCAYMVPYIAQMPANNAIYSRLIEDAGGAHAVGIYQAGARRRATRGALSVEYAEHATPRLKA